MEQRSCNAYVRRGPGRRPLVLIEDDTLDTDVLDLSPPGSSAFDIVICTGPHGTDEECPLVMDGCCPHGRPDVVVSALSPENPWSHSVQAAWRLDQVPVARPTTPLTWPEHIGAALRAMGADDDD